MALSGCSGVEQRAPAEEALAAALNVGSLSAKRAQNTDCWVRCGTGTLCNLETGRCEPGQCLARCDAAWHCVRDAKNGDYCMRDSDSSGTPGSVRLSSASQGSPPTDAGAAFVGSADSGADASATLR
jgi:hypothetical protein